MKLELEEYIDEFIKNFQLIFPNIYTNQELKIILNNNLKVINEVENLECRSLGNYNYSNKEINIKRIDNDEVKFHEFIHAIRGNEIIDPNIELGLENDIDFDIMFEGLIEGFTKWASMIYLTCKKDKFNKYYKKDNFKYLFIDKTSDNKIFYASYMILVIMVEQLDLLYSQINDKETLLDVFLKGENVCIQIKQIYDVYYEKLAKMQNYELEKNECDLLSMRSAYNLLNNLNDILSLMKELSDNYDLLDKSKIYHINEQIHSIVKEIEEELTEIFETIYQNINSHYIFDALLFTNQVETKEEKLLRIIFGEEKKEKTKSLIKAQNRLSNSIIYRD